MDWFKILVNYGVDSDGYIDPKDGDSQLIPSIVKKLVLPKIVKVVGHIWNSRSSEQVQFHISITDPADRES